MSKKNQVLEIAPSTWYPSIGPNGPKRMSSGKSKNGCCLAMLLMVVLSVIGIASCSEQDDITETLQEQNIDEQRITPEQSSVDSLAIALQNIDSIMNCGRLVHLDVYEIGKLKSVSVSVQKLTSGDLTATWINFRKDCGGEYYYSWEDAHLLKDECPYFIEAITTILSNINREVEHEERYAYVTKDDIRFFSSASEGKAWNMEVSVDYRKQNSTISMNDKDVENLKMLIQEAQEKMREIE